MLAHNKLLVAHEQEGDPLGLGLEALDVIGRVHGAVELLMGRKEHGRHGERVVEVGQGGGGELGAGVEHGLRGGLDGGALLVGWLRPGEVVVGDASGVLVETKAARMAGLAVMYSAALRYQQAT